MLRITGGEWRGRKIASPKNLAKHEGTTVRPTTAMVRESLFQRLGAKLPGSRFLDAFAGSGIMGLEALSRGTQFVLAVEKHKPQFHQLRSNYASIQVPRERITLLNRDAVALVAQQNKQTPFDLVYLDPPYGFTQAQAVVDDVLNNGWLAENGTLLVEQAARDPELTLPNHDPQIIPYGDTRVTVLSF